MSQLERFLQTEPVGSDQQQARQYVDGLRFFADLKKVAGTTDLQEVGVRSVAGLADKRPPQVNLAKAITPAAATKTTGYVPATGAGQASQLNGPGSPAGHLGGPVTHVPASTATHGHPTPRSFQAPALAKTASLADLLRGAAKIPKDLVEEAGAQGRGYMLGLAGHHDAAGDVIKEPGKLKAWLTQSRLGRKVGLTPRYTHLQEAQANAASMAPTHANAYLGGFHSGRRVAKGIDAPEMVGELNRTFRHPDGSMTPLSVLTGAQRAGLLDREGLSNAAKNVKGYVSSAGKDAEAEAKRRALLTGLAAGGTGLAGGALLASRRSRD